MPVQKLPAGNYYCRLVVEFPDGQIFASNELGPFPDANGGWPGPPPPNGWITLPAVWVDFIEEATSYKIYIGTVQGAEDHYIDCGQVPTSGKQIVLDTLGVAGAIPAIPAPIPDSPEQFVAKVDVANRFTFPVAGARGNKVIVRAVGFNNQRGAAPHATAPTKQVVMRGNAFRPHNVFNFRCTAFAAPNATLAWDAVPEAADDANLVYEIRFAWKADATPVWERATAVTTLDRNQAGYVANKGEGTYFIRALNSAGYYSGLPSSVYASAASVVITPNPDPDPLPVGGGGCPWVEMEFQDEQLVGEALLGDPFECLDGTFPLQGITRKFGIRCVRLVAENGAEYIGSWDTRFEMPDGTLVLAERMLGRPMLTDLGAGTARTWSPVQRVEEAGARDVVRIDLGNRVFAARVKGCRRRVWSHNNKISPVLDARAD